jgi:hypothetical protein
MALNDLLLQYPPRQAKWLILLIEAACTLSIAMVLVSLFAGGKVASLDPVEPSTPRERGP